MIKNIALIIIVLSLFTSLSAQTVEESFRLSDRLLSGSARGIGAGSAFGAVGADFSSATINPAGMALYRSSEFMITPSFELAINNSTYINSKTSDSARKFHIESIGVLFSRELKNSNWRFRNIGFGYFTDNKYYDQYTISAENSENSLMGYYANQASGASPELWVETDPLGIGLYYEAYIINPDPNNSYSSVGGPGLLQTETIRTDRSLREFNISASGNYKDKLYIGAAVSFPDYNYDIINTVSEEDNEDRYNTFENYNYIFTESTEADGINLRLGLIYRISNPLRVGLSFQTPTSYNLETNYSAELQSRLEGAQQGNSSDYLSPESFFTYRLRVPYNITGSAAYILKEGFLSLDYEYTDHSSSEYSAAEGFEEDQDFLDGINSQISDSFQANSTIRIGAEWAPGQLRYRAGAILKTEAFREVKPELKNTYSLGVGYRFESASIDIAYRYTTDEKEYIMYSGAPTAEIIMNRHSASASLAFRF